MRHTRAGRLAVLLVGAAIANAAWGQTKFASHPPMRPLPVARQAALAEGPKFFVDAARGNDQQDGSEARPWRSVQFAARHLRPGDTLYLRGGTYYEKVALVRSGTAEAPITIASYPGELAVIDGVYREFAESPETSWEPLAGGAAGEYVSTKTYGEADSRRIPTQFLPAAWEPMWGIEHERPLALGHFADSMIPLHGYRTLGDLRATNEFWLGNKKEQGEGIYCGPGLWLNRETGRVHIRLAHHTLPGLGERGYHGETDPRKLPLVVALGFGEEVLRINGLSHVRVRDLVVRGATGSPLVHVYGSQQIELDHLTLYGGFPALLINASQNVRLAHSALRGLAAPWSGRAHMKYRGTASYQIVLQNNQPLNENIELAWCEFTDDHDFAFLRYAKNLQFHHNLVENFNDDGLECGPKLRSHSIFIHENRIGSCLGIFQQHEIDKDESPAEHDPGSGVYIYRNVIDAREGVYYHLPTAADPSGEFLHDGGALASDHGGPTWPIMRVYQNTLLRKGPVFRDNYLFGLGVGGLRNTERDVFNNLFVQMDGVPGVKFVAMKEAAVLREGGNLLWGASGGEKLVGDPLAKFRATPLFAESRKHYEPGWTTNDRIADPRFVSLAADGSRPDDLRLQADSPAVKSGQPLPTAWPDPLRGEGDGPPDIGAIPLGGKAWGVGVDGRVPLYGNAR
jgi:hypothetical protein